MAASQAEAPAATGTGKELPRPGWVLAVAAGWLLAGAGCLAPWIRPATAALSLSGVDLAEFVKFLPDVQAGAVHVVRQAFYLPVVAVALGVASLGHELRAAIPASLRLAAPWFAALLSLQLLPPAWSPHSLIAPEFRAQAVALGVCWSALAGAGLLKRLPLRARAGLNTIVSVTSALVATWQFAIIRPEIDRVYMTTPPVGWGLGAVLLGLAIIAGASIHASLLPKG